MPYLLLISTRDKVTLPVISTCFIHGWGSCLVPGTAARMSPSLGGFAEGPQTSLWLLPLCASPIAPGPACANQEHLQVPSVALATQAGPGLAMGISPLSQVGAQFGFGKRLSTSNTWCYGKVLFYYVHNEAFCGLRLKAAYFTLFALPHCLLFAPSVCSWNLAAPTGSNPHVFCHFLHAVAEQTEKGNSTPGRGARQVPGTNPHLGRCPLAGDVFASCVYTEDSWGSIGNACKGSAEHAGWCC